MIGLVLAALLAVSYPQVPGPTGALVTPSPVAETGVDSVTGAACAAGSSKTCQRITADANEAPWTTITPMTPGQAYQPGRAILISCTTAGTVNFTTSAGSPGAWPAGVGGTILGFAVTSIGTPPTGCSVSELN